MSIVDSFTLLCSNTILWRCFSSWMSQYSLDLGGINAYVPLLNQSQDVKPAEKTTCYKNTENSLSTQRAIILTVSHLQG